MSRAGFLSATDVAMLGDLPGMRPHHLWLYMEHAEVRCFVEKYQRGEISATFANLNLRRIVSNLGHQEVDHPRENRGGCLSNPQDMDQPMGAAIAGGWIPGVVDHTTLFEVPQGGVRKMILCEDTVRRLTPRSGDALSSGGDMPAAAPGSTTYASLACEHRNAFLRALRSSGGGGDTALGMCSKQAVRDGLNWHVIQDRVERPYPTLDVLLAADRPEPRCTVQV